MRARRDFTPEWAGATSFSSSDHNGFQLELYWPSRLVCEIVESTWQSLRRIPRVFHRLYKTKNECSRPRQPLANGGATGRFLHRYTVATCGGCERREVIVFEREPFPQFFPTRTLWVTEGAFVTSMLAMAGIQYCMYGRIHYFAETTGSRIAGWGKKKNLPFVSANIEQKKLTLAYIFLPKGNILNFFCSQLVLRDAGGYPT